MWWRVAGGSDGGEVVGVVVGGAVDGGWCGVCWVVVGLV